MADQSVAFIVAIMLPDDSLDTLAGTAEAIEGSLSDDGFVVASVAPFDRASLEGAANLFPEDALT